MCLTINKLLYTDFEANAELVYRSLNNKPSVILYKYHTTSLVVILIYVKNEIINNKMRSSL